MLNQETWQNRIQSRARQRAMKVRRKLEQATRSFFDSRGYIETPTPILVPSPGMEVHIKAMSVGERFLHTSPEFAMKKLLAGGMERIYQIARVFRDEPVSDTHLPEFSMLEWYRAHADYHSLMDEVEDYVRQCTSDVCETAQLRFNESTIDLSNKFDRMTVSELFQNYVDVNIAKENTKELLSPHVTRLGEHVSDSDTWEDLYFKIWLNHIEPRLQKNKPLFVYDYPPAMAALSETYTGSDGNEWARRFELYIGGLELGNAYQELRDPKIQKARWDESNKLRKSIYGKTHPENPVDEDFLRALEEGIPPCSGIAMGFDRLVMLFSSEQDIRNTVWI